PITFATVGKVGAPRPQVVARSVVRAGESVLVNTAPWVGPEHLDVGTAPFLFLTGRRFQQHFEALFGSWITIHVHVETFQRRLELGDVPFSRAHFGVVRRADKLRDDRRGQYSYDDHHDHDFNQRKAVRRLHLPLFFHICALSYNPSLA